MHTVPASTLQIVLRSLEMSPSGEVIVSPLLESLYPYPWIDAEIPYSLQIVAVPASSVYAPNVPFKAFSHFALTMVGTFFLLSCGKHSLISFKLPFGTFRQYFSTPGAFAIELGSSNLIEDFLRPWQLHLEPPRTEAQQQWAFTGHKQLSP